MVPRYKYSQLLSFIIYCSFHCKSSKVPVNHQDVLSLCVHKNLHVSLHPLKHRSPTNNNKDWWLLNVQKQVHWIYRTRLVFDFESTCRKLAISNFQMFVLTFPGSNPQPPAPKASRLPCYHATIRPPMVCTKIELLLVILVFAAFPELCIWVV